MYGLTLKRIVIFTALIVGITLATPAAAIEGQENTAVSTAPINPDFLAYQENAQGAVLAASENEGMYSYGLIPPPLDLSHISASQSNSAVFSVQNALPVTYDLRSQGRVTGIKNQGSYGTCWAFSSLASLESTGLPTFGVKTYSEKHMVNLDGFDNTVDDGGNHLMATAYLAGWIGPVNEEDDLYPDAWDYESPTDLAPEAHVQNVLFLPELTGQEEAATLKQAIVEHGAVFTSMYIDPDHPYYNNATASYYYSGTSKANHAVTVVGWNDTYDRNLFATIPPGDGAWIIKNSWGTGFGDGGYFYLSYFDSVVGKCNTVFTGEDTGNYDTVYQYDPLGWVGSIGTGSETGWFAAVFTADADEDLRAVSLYAAQYESPYELYVYLDPATGPTNGSGPVASQTGTIDVSGYRTVPLESPVTLSAGQTFSVVVKLTTPGYTYPIPVERPKSDYSSAATAQPGEGYVRLGGAWVDLTDEFENYSPCLKAFTTVREPPLSIAGIAPDYGHLNQTVEITGLSGTNFKNEAGVMLTRTDEEDIPATGVVVLSTTQITCTLDLTDAKPGNWSVVVENPDGEQAILMDGFVVCPRGDVTHNGAVEIGDVAKIAYMVVGKAVVDPAADFNENGAVDIGDAAKIAYYFVGKIPAL
jgi:C1A family cysteine protease